MRAIVFAEPGCAAVMEGFECALLRAEQVRLRTLFSGVTVGTERGILKGSDLPHIPGYQTVSEVIEVGGAVRGVSVGDRVFSDYADPPVNFSGGGGFGHMEERVREASGNFMRLPDGFDPEQAALLGVMGIGVKASRRGGVGMGGKVLVIGLGIIGQACGQASLAMGAEVFGLDVMPERCALAEKLCCTKAFDGGDSKAWARIAEHGPYDVVFETTGLTQMYNRAFTVIKKGISRIMAVGMRGTMEYEFWKLAHLSEATIVHTEHFTAEDVRDVLKLTQRRRFDIGALITHRLPVEGAPAIYQKIIDDPSGLMGVVFDWRR